MPVTPDRTVYDLHGSTHDHTVVLIHGLGLTRQTTWDKMTAALARDCRLVTYDLLGHGETAVPVEPVTLTLLSQQLIALLDTLRIKRAALIGFSLGGMINRRCAMDHPDRVSSLVILNSLHERGETQQRLVEARARESHAGGPSATIDATLERWFTDAFRRNHRNDVDRVRAAVLANDHANYAAHRHVLAHGVKELIRPWPPITHPALVMTCEHDSGSTPQMSEAIASEISGSELCVIPQLRHLGLIEQPDLFSRPIADFLHRALPPIAKQG